MYLVLDYLKEHKIDFNVATENVIAIWHNDTFFEIIEDDTKYIIRTWNEELDCKILETSKDIGNLIFKLDKILKYPR